MACFCSYQSDIVIASADINVQIEVQSKPWCIVGEWLVFMNCLPDHNFDDMQKKSLKVKSNVSDGDLFVFLFPSIIHSLC